MPLLEVDGTEKLKVGFTPGEHRKVLFQRNRSPELLREVQKSAMQNMRRSYSLEAVAGGESHPGARHVPHPPVVVTVLPSLRTQGGTSHAKAALGLPACNTPIL